VRRLRSGSVYHALKVMPDKVSCLRTRPRPAWRADPRASIAGHLPPDANLETWGPVGDVSRLRLRTAASRAEWARRLMRRIEEGAFRIACA
jgi:hypothetical protein